MGNLIPTGARAARRAAGSGPAATVQASASKASPSSCAPPASTSYSAIPASADDEWANILRGLSGSIESSSWNGKAPSARGAEGPHAAARAESVRARLPSAEHVRSGAASKNKLSTDTSGMLTQAQVIGLFRLRRSKPDLWDAKALTEKFAVREKDLDMLIRYTRTYTARTDVDGAVRGYYDPNANPPIERFERN